jgi:hypothetical protein
VDLLGQAGLGKQLERSVDRGLPDGLVLRLDLVVEVLGRKMALLAQEHVQNEPPLRRHLEVLPGQEFGENSLGLFHGCSLAADVR